MQPILKSMMEGRKKMSGILAWGASKAASAALSRIKDEIVPRLQRVRGENFVRGLVDAVRDEMIFDEPNEGADAYLDKMLSHERCAEAIFEAYRRVSLSRSREIGPRIIGYMTACIMADERLATEQEERWYDAAEAMSDSELRSFILGISTWIAPNSVVTGEHAFPSDLFTQVIGDDSMDDSRVGRIDTSSMLTGMDSWTRKLASVGIIHERIVDERTPADRRVESGSTRRVTWTLVFPGENERFITLTRRAIDSIKEKS